MTHIYKTHAEHRKNGEHKCTEFINNTLRTWRIRNTEWNVHRIHIKYTKNKQITLHNYIYHEICITGMMFTHTTTQDNHSSVGCVHSLAIHPSNIWNKWSVARKTNNRMTDKNSCEMYVRDKEFTVDHYKTYKLWVLQISDVRRNSK